MPRRASSPSELSLPHTASFPIHTWCSFAPISAPHSQAGLLNTTAYVWTTWSISMYVHCAHEEQNTGRRESDSWCDHTSRRYWFKTEAVGQKQTACHLPPPLPLLNSLWQENTQPPGLHHKACLSFSQRWCADPQWRGAEPQRCHRRMGAFSVNSLL